MSVLTAPEAPVAPPRGGLLGAVRRHPIVSFFVLANLASWIAWIPYILSLHGLGVWDFHYPGGPIGGQLLGVLPGAYLGPIGSALLVTAIADGRAGVRTWARRLWRWKVGWRWYVGILLGVPLAMVLSALVFSGGQLHVPSAALLAALVPGLLAQMVTTGLAEEPGWRDFALPRVQRLLGAPKAAVVIGALWGLWHMPLYLTEWGGWPDVSWYRPIEFVLFCITFNVLMTWVFNRTGQSLPMAMLLHVSINNFASIVWAETFPTLDVDVFQHSLLLAATVAAVLTLVGSRGRLGYVPELEEPVARPVHEAARLS